MLNGSTKRRGLRKVALKWAGGVGGTLALQGVSAAGEYESDAAVYGDKTAKRWRRERTFSIHGGTGEDLDAAANAATNWFHRLLDYEVKPK